MPIIFSMRWHKNQRGGEKRDCKHQTDICQAGTLAVGPLSNNLVFCVVVPA